jgi:hypothetical protein
MTKFIVVETTKENKDRKLAVKDSLAEAMKEQKKQRKLVPDTSAVSIAEKDTYDFIQKHNKKKSN